ncbi:MAG TPA: sulfurtransferase, partial [Chondromyces sp.]|nr:sulfurtransferase [Chondromyces sp.]
MKNIVTSEWLFNRIDDPNVRIIDCRFDLMEPDWGTEQYQASHIQGAIYAHLEKDLSGTKQKHGGRHPLPGIDELKATFESFGIDEHTTVVAYDNGEGMFAGRCWWLLSFLGHPHVYILDGGWENWKESDLPVSQEMPEVEEKTFLIQPQYDWLASLDEVKSASLKGEGAAVLMDSRAPDRYRGEVEPLDRIPGHIPGAVNYFFKEAFEGFHWKPIEKQKERFSRLDSSRPV